MRRPSFREGKLGPSRFILCLKFPVLLHKESLPQSTSGKFFKSPGKRLETRASEKINKEYTEASLMQYKA